MINYLVINVMLSLSTLAIDYSMQIPHRIRFYILMVALIGWLTPFALMTIELTQQSVSMLPVQWAKLTEPILSNNTIIQTKFDFMFVFFALMAIGLIRFVTDIVATEKHIRKLKYNFKPLQNHENIYMAQGIKGAFVSGYFKPIIWIDEQLQQSETLLSVITHEQQHINSHDQFWLLIITLVQRLFWFNPLSLILSQKTRKGIELSCDEACKNKLGKSTYQSHLAQLIMVKHQTANAVLNNQIHHDEKFNIHRIKQLNQENKMTTSHKTKLFIFAILAILMSSYSLVSVANESAPSKLKDNEVLLGIKWKIDKTHAGIQKSSELNSEVVVNDYEFKSFHFDEHEIKVKAQRANQGLEPKYYMIETKISGNADYPVTEPAVMVETGKTAVIRIADTESERPVSHQIELSFTVLTESQLAKKSSDMIPVAAAAKINPVPALQELAPTPAKISAPESIPAAVEPHAPVTAPTPEKKDNDA